MTAAPDRTDLLAGNDAHAAGGTTCQKADFLNGAFGAASLQECSSSHRDKHTNRIKADRYLKVYLLNITILYAGVHKRS